MGRIKYKISGIMGLIALAAIGLSAFRSLPSRWPSFAECIAVPLNLAGRWATEISMLIGLSYLVAIAIALAAKGRARATAVGYATFGLVYYEAGSNSEPYSSFLYAHLITPNFWKWIHQSSFTYNKVLSFASYSLATHCLLTVAAGLAGGLLARALTRRPGDPAPSTANTAVDS